MSVKEIEFTFPRSGDCLFDIAIELIWARISEQLQYSRDKWFNRRPIEDLVEQYKKCLYLKVTEQMY